jgi:hypothetical protein
VLVKTSSPATARAIVIGSERERRDVGFAEDRAVGDGDAVRTAVDPTIEMRPQRRPVRRSTAWTALLRSWENITPRLTTGVEAAMPEKPALPG